MDKRVSENLTNTKFQSSEINYTPLRLLVGHGNNAPIQNLINCISNLETSNNNTIEKSRSLAYDQLNRVALEQKRRFDTKRRKNKKIILGDCFYPSRQAGAPI